MNVNVDDRGMNVERPFLGIVLDLQLACRRSTSDKFNRQLMEYYQRILRLVSLSFGWLDRPNNLVSILPSQFKEIYHSQAISIDLMHAGWKYVVCSADGMHRTM